MALISNGNYEQGIAELKLAYETLPHPNVLYNIARAYTEAGDLENAIAYYKRYTDENPPDKEETLQVLGQLQARLERQRATLAAARQATQPATAPAAGTTPGAQPTAETPTGEPGEPVATAPTEKPGAAPTPVEKPNVGAARLEGVYEETVVTASRGAQSPLQSPNSTTIITQQDIRLSGITKIPELLRRVAGVDIMQTTGGNTDVSIRGFNTRVSNKLLVLVDGRSVFLDWLGATFWEALSVTVDDIERIEVVRGPGSALYGADAFAGVVNIITKAPGEGKSIAHVGVGDQVQTFGTVRVTGRDGDFAYKVTANYTRNPRWSRPISPERRDAQDTMPLGDAASEFTKLDIRTTRRLGKDVTFGIGGGLAQGGLEFISIGALKDYYIDRSRWGDVTAFLNAKQFSLRTFYNFTDANIGSAANWRGQALYPTPVRMNVVDVEPVLAEKFEVAGIGNAITVGGNYRLRQSYSRYTGGDRTEHHWGVFAQDAISFSDAVQLVLSGRVDYVPYVQKVIPSPRGSLIVHPTEKSTIRGTLATAFRKPTFLEGYTDIGVQAPVGDASSIVDSVREGVALGRRLQPERILTAELGYLNQESDYFDVEANAYFNRVTDLITLNPNSFLTPSQRGDDPNSGFNPNTGRYTIGYTGFVNQCADYNVVGGEVGARTYPVSGLDLFANYAINRAFANIPAGCIQPTDQRTSQHKVNVGMQVRTKPGIDGEVVFHYVSSQQWAERAVDAQLGEITFRSYPLPAYSLVNARLGYRFLRDQAEVYGTVFNLLNNVHQEHPFGNFVGRRFMAFLTYKF
jgi:iron complex outermembrane receptor protein